MSFTHVYEKYLPYNTDQANDLRAVHAVLTDRGKIFFCASIRPTCTCPNLFGVLTD